MATGETKEKLKREEDCNKMRASHNEIHSRTKTLRFQKRNVEILFQRRNKEILFAEENKLIYFFFKREQWKYLFKMLFRTEKWKYFEEGN